MNRHEASEIRELAEAWARAKVKARVKAIDASTCGTSSDYAAARAAESEADDAETAFDEVLRRMTTC